MRDRRNPACRMNAVDHLFGRRAVPWHEGRPAGRQPATRRRRSWSGHGPPRPGHARSTAGRPTIDGSSIAGFRIASASSTMPCSAQPLDDLAQPVDAHAPLLDQKRREHRRRDVDEVAQCVHVDAVEHGRHFDAGDELDAGGATGGRGGRAAGHRIVIGDAQHHDARRRCAGHELGRRAAAVGCGGMGVEIDQRADLAPDAPVRRVRVRGRWRSVSARYSRISRSRCSRSSSANSRKICLPCESSKRSP